MIRTYSQEEIELIRESSLLVGETLAEVAKYIAPGVETMELENVAIDFIAKTGGVPGFKGYEGYPYALCISVNEVVVHGYPSKYKLKEGDIVSVDCGVYKNGFHGDSAYTFAVGKVSEEVDQLLRVTKESLYLGIEQAIAGNRTGDIGWAVQNHAEKFGYGVVRELIGHGVGEKLHDKPDVPNYGRKGSGTKLIENSVIAIEPMITLGKRNIKVHPNGWNILTVDGKPAAHFEHDVLVTRHGPEILSSFEAIEKVLNNK